MKLAGVKLLSSREREESGEAIPKASQRTQCSCPLLPLILMVGSSSSGSPTQLGANKFLCKGCVWGP